MRLSLSTLERLALGWRGWLHPSSMVHVGPNHSNRHRFKSQDQGRSKLAGHGIYTQHAQGLSDVGKSPYQTVFSVLNHLLKGEARKDSGRVTQARSHHYCEICRCSTWDESLDVVNFFFQIWKRSPRLQPRIVLGRTSSVQGLVSRTDRSLSS